MWARARVTAFVGQRGLGSGEKPEGNQKEEDSPPLFRLEKGALALVGGVHGSGGTGRSRRKGPASRPALGDV